MSKIYLPTEYIDAPCKVVNNGYIRVYTNSSLTQYTDIYINQDYQLKSGYSQYGFTGTCDTLNTYVDNLWYRIDIDKICIVYMSIICLLWFLCSLFFKAFFKGPRRL